MRCAGIALNTRPDRHRIFVDLEQGRARLDA
jgi:hypothetical protein